MKHRGHTIKTGHVSRLIWFLFILITIYFIIIYICCPKNEMFSSNTYTDYCDKYYHMPQSNWETHSIDSEVPDSNPDWDNIFAIKFFVVF